MYFSDYGFASPADLYSVADTIIVRWNIQGQHYGPLEESNASHVVTLPIEGFFHRDDLGITVIPSEDVEDVEAV